MRYSVGVRLIGKMANDLPTEGNAIDYVAAAPWPPSWVARMRPATVRAADTVAKG
jgi:hypothetical protein